MSLPTYVHPALIRLARQNRVVKTVPKQTKPKTPKLPKLSRKLDTASIVRSSQPALDDQIVVDLLRQEHDDMGPRNTLPKKQELKQVIQDLGETVEPPASPVSKNPTGKNDGITLHEIAVRQLYENPAFRNGANYKEDITPAVNQQQLDGKQATSEAVHKQINPQSYSFLGQKNGFGAPTVSLGNGYFVAKGFVTSPERIEEIISSIQQIRPELDADIAREALRKALQENRVLPYVFQGAFLTLAEQELKFGQDPGEDRRVECLVETFPDMKIETARVLEQYWRNHLESVKEVKRNSEKDRSQIVHLIKNQARKLERVQTTGENNGSVRFPWWQLAPSTYSSPAPGSESSVPSAPVSESTVPSISVPESTVPSRTPIQPRAPSPPTTTGQMPPPLEAPSYSPAPAPYCDISAVRARLNAFPTLQISDEQLQHICSRLNNSTDDVVRYVLLTYGFGT